MEIIKYIYLSSNNGIIYLKVLSTKILPEVRCIYKNVLGEDSPQVFSRLNLIKNTLKQRARG